MGYQFILDNEYVDVTSIDIFRPLEHEMQSLSQGLGNFKPFYIRMQTNASIKLSKRYIYMNGTYKQPINQ